MLLWSVRNIDNLRGRIMDMYAYILIQLSFISKLSSRFDLGSVSSGETVLVTSTYIGL